MTSKVMTMVRDLFGRKIEFKPIEDFDDDEKC